MWYLVYLRGCSHSSPQSFHGTQHVLESAGYAEIMSSLPMMDMVLVPIFAIINNNVENILIHMYLTGVCKYRLSSGTVDLHGCNVSPILVYPS